MATLLGVSADEIRVINRRFGGVTQLNGSVETVFELAEAYQLNFWDRVAAVVRSVAGGHLFDNGNKRTAFEAVKLFRMRNEVVTGATDPLLRETIRLVAAQALKEIPAIAKSLRGF